MKTLFLLLCLFSLTTTVHAQSYQNEPSLLEWKLNENPPAGASVSPEGSFSSTGFTEGSQLPIRDIRPTAGVDFLRFRPNAQVANADPAHALTFTLIPAAGLSFSPSNIRFKTLRYGTDGGFLMVAAKKASDVSETQLVAEFKPNRDNSGIPTEIDQSIRDITVTGEAWIISIYIYGLGNTKEIGLAELSISGVLNGTREQLTQYTLTTKVQPEDAGTIIVNPPATTYDENTEVNLSTQRKFGYRFLDWVDQEGNILSSESSFAHTMQQDMEITARYEALDTYRLDLSVEGGANDYMVQALPEGTLIDGKRMYEAGSRVEVKATSNTILSFVNWENNETLNVRQITMDTDKQLTATYEAQDYILAWDFYRQGNNGRVPDFVGAEENEASVLVLRDESGNTQGWLDKSMEAADGFYGYGGGLIWKPFPHELYFQTRINAGEFKNIRVLSKMIYQYGAYTKNDLEWSLDGQNWILAASVSLDKDKVWMDLNADLPEAADNAPELYLRWKPDQNSPRLKPEETQDGTGLGEIYVLGERKPVNDGIPPVLTSILPADNATGVSAAGQIVLLFDEKIKISEDVTATLNTQVLSPSVAGRAIRFPYSGLSYNTEYTFSLAANTVADQGDNYLATPISIRFTTMDKPEVSQALYDYVVEAGDVDDLKKAIATANADQTGERFRIFIPEGDYNFGSAILTAINRSNISLIGAGEDKTVLRNNPPAEGIGVTAILLIQKGVSDTYIENVSLKSDWDYPSKGGRAVVLQDKGDKTILKQVSMLSYQDTYYSNNNTMRAYLEDCSIHGTVDFICGTGDIFFQRNQIYLEDRAGNCIMAPRGNTRWGYVFNDCTIDGATSTNGTYSLGRPWGESPKAVYLNTTMKVLPAAAGWADMGPLPGLFAEYKSHTGSGAPVDVSQRKTVYQVEGIPTPYTGPTVLSDEQAAAYTLYNVLGGDDNWMPDMLTEPAPTPELSLEGNMLVWPANQYSLCYLIFKEGNYWGQTIGNRYELAEDGVYSVRAANEMGGLSSVSNQVSVSTSSLENGWFEAETAPVDVYDIHGRLLRQQVEPAQATDGLEKGVYIVGRKKVILNK